MGLVAIGAGVWTWLSGDVPIAERAVEETATRHTPPPAAVASAVPESAPPRRVSNRVSVPARHEIGARPNPTGW